VHQALRAALTSRGIDADAADPWRFPTEAEYRARLERRGFVVRTMTLIPRPTLLPGGLGDWLDTFGESFLRCLPEHDRAAVKRDIEQSLRPRLCDANGRWTVDYVRLRFAAAKPPTE
jgi:hypothetical protein